MPSGGLGVASASSYNLSRPVRACELRIASDRHFSRPPAAASLPCLPGFGPRGMR